MTFHLQYEPDYQIIIQSVVCDSSGIIPELVSQPGTVIYEYFQAQIALVSSDVLLYRIESDQGNIAGYVGIQVNNGVATQVLYQLRPAYNDLEISPIIANFIQSNSFLKDSIY